MQKQFRGSGWSLFSEEPLREGSLCVHRPPTNLVVMKSYSAWFDGSCWPNPNGQAGCGAYVELDGKWVFWTSKYLGCQDTSNNVAEYCGLIEILKFMKKVEEPSEVKIYGDADLVIKQMTGVWKAGVLTKKERKGKIPIKPRYYLPYYDEAQELLRESIHTISFHWIPREQNTDADYLSTKCLEDRGFKVFKR